MRKLLQVSPADGIPLLPSPPLPSLVPSSTPATSPSLTFDNSSTAPAFFFFPPLPIIDCAFDLATLCFISGLLLLCLLSVSFILHLRLKSTQFPHLRKFNNLWTVRLLLVSLISLWALNEIFHLPFFRRQYLHPLLPSLSEIQQSNLCKIHIVFSLGFFEPGFLLTLVFLVNLSITKRNPNHIRTVATVIVMCFPTLLMQAALVFYKPLESRLPEFMHRSSVSSVDDFGNKTVICTCPLLSSIVFTMFGFAYSLGLLLTCWRVVAFVINKGLRNRIKMLAFTVTTAVSLQILFLGMSSLWAPEDSVNNGVVFASFLVTVLCAAIGECILVIKPIVDALAVAGDSTRLSPSILLPPSPTEVLGPRRNR